MLLSKEQLIAYLKQVIELESAIVTQERIITASETMYDNNKPNLVQHTLPNEPLKVDSKKYFPGTTTNMLTFWGCLLIGIGLIFLIAVRSTVGASRNSDIALAEFIVCYVPMIVGAILFVINILKGIDDDNTNQKLMQRYTNQCDEINRKNTLIAYEHSKKINEWTNLKREAFEYMSRPLEETKAILEKIYSSDIIYAKYRNLPALTSIYEYLLTGRCEELSGAHGAYNLYEDEIRKDKVISQLNTVIENLEQIRYNQYMLYEQIKGIQQTTFHIMNEMQQIKGYTMAMSELLALNTYYAGIDAMNSTALAYYRSL